MLGSIFSQSHTISGVQASYIILNHHSPAEADEEDEQEAKAKTWSCFLTKSGGARAASLVKVTPSNCEATVPQITQWCSGSGVAMGRCRLQVQSHRQGLHLHESRGYREDVHVGLF